MDSGNVAVYGDGREAPSVRWCQSVNGISVLLSSLTLVAMATMITLDVVLRYVFSAPLPASVEISQLMQPYVVLLPMAYTLAVGQHVKVTVLTVRLPPRLRSALEVFVYIIDAVFFACIAVYAWQEFYVSYSVDEIMLAAIRLPWWVGKFALPLGMLGLIFQALVHITMTVGRMRRGLAAQAVIGGA